MKKIYLLITAALLLCGSSAWASGSARLNEGEEIPIEDALSEWATAGGTLQLLSTCNVSGPTLTIAPVSEAVLDLNSQTFTYTGVGIVNTVFLVNKKNCSVTFTDKSNAATGALNIITDTSSDKNRAIESSNGLLTIEKGTYSVTASTAGVSTRLLLGYSSSLLITGGVFNGSITASAGKISGGSFSVEPRYTYTVDGKVFKLKNDGYYHVEDGTWIANIDIKGYYDANMLWADCKLDTYTTINVLTTEPLEVERGCRVAVTKDCNLKALSGASIQVKSGSWSTFSLTKEDGGELQVIGGNFTESIYTDNGIAQYIPEGYNAYVNPSDSKYYVIKTSDILATIDGYPYTDFVAALRASSDGHPAKLYKDISNSSKIQYGGYIDMNGFNIDLGDTGYFALLRDKLSIANSKTTGGVIRSTRSDAAIVFAGYSKTTTTNRYTLSILENVTLISENDYAIMIQAPSSSYKMSAGVIVNVAGKVFGKYGSIYIHGLVQVMTGNVPEINIKDGAVLGDFEDECNASSCIYAAGYGKWTIGAATLKAATPIYSKAGILEVNGATIKACGAFSNARPNGNGFFSTGDGIVLDSKAGYAGNMQLLVTSATITSENAYAIQEVKTESPTSQTINMTIQHGSLAGQKGALAVSDDFAAIAEDGGRPDGTFVVNAVIGGKYSTKPTVIADGYEAVQIYGQEPFMWEVKAKTEASYTTKEFAETSYDEFTVPANEEYVVKNGQTITIGKLTIGNDADSRARVRVEPTGKLIIGEGGIAYNNNKGVESLLLESSNSSTGILMFNGASKLTSSILGTVEMYAHTRIIDAATNEYLCQHFGLPLYVGGASIEKNAPAAYGVWNVQNGWENVHSSYILNNGPWDGNNVTTNTENEGSLFKFKGCLVGNVDATYNFTSGDYGYKFFGNSYTAPMKMTELMNQYAAKVGVDGSVWDGTVWVFKPSDYETMGQHFVQWNGAEAIEENAMIDPLQGFFLLHKSNEETSFTVEYSKAVLGYSTMGAEDVTVENKGKITITDGQSTASLNLYEGEGLSDDFDFNYDGYQMETGTIQIYVTSGGQKWSSFGSNSFDGKEIVIVSKANTEITMSFSKLGGNAFKLTDKASGAEVEVAADKTYKFTVEPNSTVTRFKLGEGEVSAEEADADAVKIWVAENNLNIAGAAEGDAIEVINLAGIKVLSAVATGEGVQTISLSGIASGAYIVKAGAATVKFVK